MVSKWVNHVVSFMFRDYQPILNVGRGIHHGASFHTVCTVDGNDGFDGFCCFNGRFFVCPGGYWGLDHDIKNRR